MAREDFRGEVIVGKPWEIEDIFKKGKEENLEFSGMIMGLDKIRTERKTDFITIVRIPPD